MASRKTANTHVKQAGRAHARMAGHTKGHVAYPRCRFRDRRVFNKRVQGGADDDSTRRQGPGPHDLHDPHDGNLRPGHHSPFRAAMNPECRVPDASATPSPLGPPQPRRAGRLTRLFLPMYATATATVPVHIRIGSENALWPCLSRGRRRCREPRGRSPTLRHLRSSCKGKTRPGKSMEYFVEPSAENLPDGRDPPSGLDARKYKDGWAAPGSWVEEEGYGMEGTRQSTPWPAATEDDVQQQQQWRMRSWRKRRWTWESRMRIPPPMRMKKVRRLAQFVQSTDPFGICHVRCRVNGLSHSSKCSRQ
jgi:hypothetical protein